MNNDIGQNEKIIDNDNKHIESPANALFKSAQEHNEEASEECLPKRMDIGSIEGSLSRSVDESEMQRHAESINVPGIGEVQLHSKRIDELMSLVTQLEDSYTTALAES